MHVSTIHVDRPPGLSKPHISPGEKPKSDRNSRTDFLICLVLLLATLFAYAPVRHFDFVDYDDPAYVHNRHVKNGISPESIAWAFTSGEAANWFPVTRLSHLLDHQVFGENSGLQHLVNVLLHAIATLLLFAFLNRATGARWPSAFVAFLFALHPLHVESVAWVAERKDVLSACFWFLALWCYVRYAERPALARYLLVLLSFTLGLMSKPTVVTLPFVLLLVDIWPLRRMPLIGLEDKSKRRIFALLKEKIPFFALSAAAAIVTYLVQQHSGAVASVSRFGMGLRVENALVSYLVYIGKMFWPSGLAVFYPYPVQIPAWQPALAALVLIGVSVLVVLSIRAYPYLAVGWSWYLGTLVPVIGIVQVGEQARADRYMYIPMVGLGLMLAWSGKDILQRWPKAKMTVVILAAAVCSSCVALTSAQVQYWRNSESLFQRALGVTNGNSLAETDLGAYVLDVPGHLPEAISHLEAALRINPNRAEAQDNLGLALSRTGRLPEAIAHLQMAVKLKPESAVHHKDLADALLQLPGNLPEAIAQYEMALSIDPYYAAAHNNFGAALSRIPERIPEAINQFKLAVRVDPGYAEAHNNLAAALMKLPGRVPDAISEYEAALRLKPDYAEAHMNLGNALSQETGHLPEAISQYEAALRLRPEFSEAHYNLGNALARTGHWPEAIAHFETALRLRPDYAKAHYSLAIALMKVDRVPDAIAHFETAEQIRPDPRLRQIFDRLRSTHR